MKHVTKEQREKEKEEQEEKKEEEKKKTEKKEKKEEKEEKEEKGGSVSCHRILDWFPASTSHGRRCHTIKPYISHVHNWVINSQNKQ